MQIIDRKLYEKILLQNNFVNRKNKLCVDVYHIHNWDHFVMQWDEENRNDTPSYIDFFFDAKSMVTLLYSIIHNLNFKICYVAPIYDSKYKLKLFDDDVCMDIYNEFKSLLHFLSLRVNTNKAIEMNKEEFINWISRFSIGGFCGVSEYSIFIPEEELMIVPYHHMNYLFYTSNKDLLVTKINKYKNDEIVIY